MVIAINKEFKISEAEVKLGINLFKSFVKVSKEDSAKVIDLKESVVKVEYALDTKDESQLLECNKEMIRKYRYFLLAPATGLIAVDESTMRKMPFEQKYKSLFSIGMYLIQEINKEKFGQSISEGVKVGFEYYIDKVKEKNNQIK